MSTWKWHLELHLLIFFSAVSPIVSLKFSIPSHGCYWNVSCQDTRFGDCGMGHIISGYSSDCKGLCSEPEHSFCTPPHSTRFYCCIPESPRATKDRCTKCESMLDNGNDYTCCTDCSYPRITSDDPKFGCCESGAELLTEPYAKGVSRAFKWVAGPWTPCSSPCHGRIRYREVGCYAVFEDTMVPDYPVYGHKCSAEEMPAREEPCDLYGCHEPDAGGISTWTFTGVIFLIAAIGLTVFAGYIRYKRRTAMQYGLVYIMVEGFS